MGVGIDWTDIQAFEEDLKIKCLQNSVHSIRVLPLGTAQKTNTTIEKLDTIKIQSDR